MPALPRQNSKRDEDVVRWTKQPTDERLETEGRAPPTTSIKANLLICRAGRRRVGGKVEGKMIRGIGAASLISDFGQTSIPDSARHATAATEARCLCLCQRGEAL